VVSGHGNNEMAVKAMRAGAIDCVHKTSRDFTDLYPLVLRAYERRASTPLRQAGGPTVRSDRYRIAVVDSLDGARKALVEHIRANAAQIDIIELRSPEELTPIFKGSDRIDAAILGAMTPPGTQLDVLRTIRSQSPETPVILTAAVNDGETAVAAFQLGAADYIFQAPGALTETLFSLSKCLRQASLLKRNNELAGTLVSLNLSLEKQVAARTEQLQALSKRLIRIQENERAAIARELHDQLGQMLTGLMLQVEGASAVAISPAKEKLDGTRALAADILAIVREMTLQLRPRILDDFGLRPALEWHIELFQKRTGIAIEREFSLPPERLSLDLETTIFRMVQEALNNIARHTCVLLANVTLVHDGEWLMAEVTDRGPGFDVAVALARYDSLGLVGLKERVELAGGRLEIFSVLGQGTRLHASFPVEVPLLTEAS